MSKLWTRFEMKTLRSINSLPTSPGEINFVLSQPTTAWRKNKLFEVVKLLQLVNHMCESYTMYYKYCRFQILSVHDLKLQDTVVVGATL